MSYLITTLGDHLSPEAQLAWKNLLFVLVDVVAAEQNRIKAGETFIRIFESEEVGQPSCVISVESQRITFGKHRSYLFRKKLSSRNRNILQKNCIISLH